MTSRGGISAIMLLLSTLLFSSMPALAQDLTAAVEQLATQIAKGGAAEGKQVRIAIADFPDLQGVTSDFGRFVSSRLTTRLANNPRFFVIERQRLSQVLEELRFSMSDLVDPTKAKQLGRMAGVEVIVVGTVSDLGNKVEVDARLIEIETNRMLLGANATISKDEVVARLMDSGPREPRTPSAPPGSPGGVQTTRPSGSAKPDSVGGMVFQPRGCRRGGEAVFCIVAFINSGTDDRVMRVYDSTYAPRSRLSDNKGNQYPTSIRIGDRTTGKIVPGYLVNPTTLDEKFPPRLPSNVIFFTERVDPAATHMTLVIGIESILLRGGRENVEQAHVVRNIPISK